MGVRFTRTAVIARGRRHEAADFAATISEYWLENFGVPVTWGFEVGGNAGAIHWHADYEDLAHVEQAIGFSTTDEGFVKLIDDAADLFVAPPEDKLILTM